MLFGVLIIGWYNKYNANAFLVSKLYRQSNDAFQSMRSIFSPEGAPHHQKSANSGESKIFDTFKNRTLTTNLSQDFSSRNVIAMPSTWDLVKGTCCRTKSFKRFTKLQKRGTAKVKKDLDMLNVLG